MSKIIINNHSKAEDLLVLSAVTVVISEGRISDNGKCYCFATKFPQQKLWVCSEVTKAGTDKFVVFDAEPKE